MTNIQDKYKAHRAEIKHGDIILFRGSSLMAHLIMFFDSAYYTHVGVVFEIGNRKMIVDSNGKGVHPDFLSERIRDYKDFAIISPKDQFKVPNAVELALDRGDARTRYDFLLLLRIAIIKKTGINLTGLGKKDRDICSEFARYYANFIADTYKNKELITPQDFVRCIDEKFSIALQE